MLVAFVLIDGDVEYTTLFHLSNEMMWYIPYHSVQGKVGALNVMILVCVKMIIRALIYTLERLGT